MFKPGCVFDKGRKVTVERLLLFLIVLDNNCTGDGGNINYFLEKHIWFNLCKYIV